MRIISGIAKGRKLFSPPLHNKSIRPTSDRAREALFSILGKSIQGAKVLDLFAGTGAMGLEAFSRNADCVVFIDNNRLALDLIKKNIALCLSGHISSCQLRVVQHDLTKSIPFADLPLDTQPPFDLIFADPPYNTTISMSVLNSINDSNILTQSGKLILEERFNMSLPDRLSHLALIDKRVYGETGFWMYGSSLLGASHDKRLT